MWTQKPHKDDRITFSKAHPDKQYKAFVDHFEDIGSGFQKVIVMSLLDSKKPEYVLSKELTKMLEKAKKGKLDKIQPLFYDMNNEVLAGVKDKMPLINAAMQI